MYEPSLHLVFTGFLPQNGHLLQLVIFPRERGCTSQSIRPSPLRAETYHLVRTNHWKPSMARSPTFTLPQKHAPSFRARSTGSVYAFTTTDAVQWPGPRWCTAQPRTIHSESMKLHMTMNLFSDDMILMNLRNGSQTSSVYHITTSIPPRPSPGVHDPSGSPGRAKGADPRLYRHTRDSYPLIQSQDTYRTSP